MAIHSEKIERVDKDGDRKYLHNGKAWSSVNKIIDAVEDKSFLIAWKKKIGEDAANEISRNASRNGTEIHRANEAHFTNEIVELTKEQQRVQNKFQPFLNSVVEAIDHETKVVWTATLDEYGRRSDDGISCGVGGTFDALLRLNPAIFVDSVGDRIFDFDEPFVAMVDYKSQKKKKQLEYMLRYYLQLAAYIGALNQVTNKKYEVDKAFIVAATSRNLYLYYLSPKKVRWYWKQWLKIVAAYFYNHEYDWNAFKYAAQGYKLIDGEYLLDGESYMPQQVYLDESLLVRN